MYSCICVCSESHEESSQYCLLVWISQYWGRDELLEVREGRREGNHGVKNLRMEGSKVCFEELKGRGSVCSHVRQKKRIGDQKPR